MNARISVPPAAVPRQPWDEELECAALGLALLGYPVPEWLDASDFFAETHRYVFRAVRELGDAASLPTVAALLRDQGRLAHRRATPHYADDALHSAHLALWCSEAQFAMDMGWAVDFAKLRELRNQRRLLEAMRRVEIAFEHEAMSHREARKALSEHFERSSK